MRVNPISSETIPVAVVGGEAFARTGIVALIRSQPDLAVVDEAAELADAIAMICRERPEVVVLDTTASSGIAVTAARGLLDEVQPVCPRLVVVRESVDDESVESALACGVCALLTSTVCPTRLVAAIRAVAAGDIVLSQDAIAAIAQAYVNPKALRVRVSSLSGLTERELEVVRLVARGMCNIDIAAVLDIGEATVKTHLSRTMAKLNVGTRAQMVTFAYEVGLVVPGQPGLATSQVYLAGSA